MKLGETIFNLLPEIVENVRNKMAAKTAIAKVNLVITQEVNNHRIGRVATLRTSYGVFQKSRTFVSLVSE